MATFFCAEAKGVILVYKCVVLVDNCFFTKRGVYLHFCSQEQIYRRVFNAMLLLHGCEIVYRLCYKIIYTACAK